MMDDVIIYRKIPKISLGAYIFQRPFLRGLYSEGLIYGRKFAFQNRLPLGWRYSWKEIYLFCFVLLCIWGQLPSTSPKGGGAYIWRDDLTEGFLRYEFGGLIFGGAYTRRCLFLEFYGMTHDIINCAKNTCWVQSSGICDDTKCSKKMLLAL